MKTRRSFLSLLMAAPLAVLGLKRAAGGNPPEGPWLYLGLRTFVTPSLDEDPDDFGAIASVEHEWHFVDPDGIYRVARSLDEARPLYAKSVDGKISFGGSRVYYDRRIHQFELSDPDDILSLDISDCALDPADFKAAMVAARQCGRPPIEMIEHLHEMLYIA